MPQKKHIQTQTEWENEMAGKILDFIKSEVYLDLPFMGIALGKLVPQPKGEIRTFATDGIYCYFSTENLLRLFQKNAKFLDRAYLHTVMHCIFSHLWIGGQRNRQLWGIACDIAVEYVIDGMDKPCTKRILSYLRQKTYAELKKIPEGISAATIYLWLLEKESRERTALQREFHTDDHRYWPKEEQEQSSAGREPEPQKEWRKIARQTSMQQKKQGQDESDGEKAMAALLSANKSRRNYRDFLRQFAILREEIHCDPDSFDLAYYTYGLRVYGNMPLIEPLESREIKKVREFVIAIDTSFSTSGELVKNFLRETYTLLSQADSFFRKTYIHIIQCDDRIRRDETITTEREMEKLLKEFVLVGGGGTDFRPVFAHVNSLIEAGIIKDLTGLIYFTDGKGIYPRKRPEYKTAFLYLGPYDRDAVPPWAIQMQLEPAEFLPGPDGKQIDIDGKYTGPSYSSFPDEDDMDITDLPNT